MVREGGEGGRAQQVHQGGVICQHRPSDTMMTVLHANVWYIRRPRTVGLMEAS